MTDLDTATVSTADLCAFLGVNNATIGDMQRRGIIRKLKRNTWPFRESVAAVLAHYREVAAGRSTADGGLDLVEERAKLARAQRQSQELKNAVARGEYILADDVAEIWGSMVTRSRARLLALPSKLAPALVGHDDPRRIEGILEGEVHEALDELANGDQAEEADRGALALAAETEDQPVG